MASNKKNGKFHWNSSDTHKLIEFIREYEYIYNPKQNTGLRDKAFENAAKIMAYSVNDVKSRWEGLRTYFSREMTKVTASKKNGFGTVDIYEPKWEFFPDMLFLQMSLQPRKARSGMEIVKEAKLIQEEQNEEDNLLNQEDWLRFFADEIIEPNFNENESGNNNPVWALMLDTLNITKPRRERKK